MNITIKSNFINTSPVNQGLYEKNFAIKGSEQQGRKDSDTMSISPLGKAKNLIESLTKQKEKIVESKNELIGRTLEKGGNMDSIKTRLDDFEEQIKSIDNQIAQITAEQLKQQAEEQKKMAYKKPKTEDEVETERLHSMVSMSSSMDQAKVVSSVKTKVEGEAKVLGIEIKLDASRRGVHSSKYERLAELENKASDLTGEVGKTLGKVYEEIKDNNENSEDQLTEPDYSKTTKNHESDEEIKDKKERDIADKTEDDDTDSNVK